MIPSFSWIAPGWRAGGIKLVCVLTSGHPGSYQEVAWYCGANHAGGYSYRLCKMPEGGISEVTEECFQQTPLEFVGDEQWVEYAVDRTTGIRTELKPLQTTEGMVARLR